ncbi:hypothetical protein ACFQU1_20545 [Chelatococcus sp. GCM10030263]|uniref:hypothetical protein n=1 Tax=Chelatococcus sp. GCM10030263 TaxID=3273387 RepID=UPI00361DBCE5
MIAAAAAAILANWRLALAGGLLVALGLAAWTINDRAFDRGHAAALVEIQKQITHSEGLIDEETRRARDAARDAARRVCEQQDDPGACRDP